MDGAQGFNGMGRGAGRAVVVGSVGHWFHHRRGGRVLGERLRHMGDWLGVLGGLRHMGDWLHRLGEWLGVLGHMGVLRQMGVLGHMGERLGVRIPIHIRHHLVVIIRPWAIYIHLRPHHNPRPMRRWSTRYRWPVGMGSIHHHVLSLLKTPTLGGTRSSLDVHQPFFVVLPKLAGRMLELPHPTVGVVIVDLVKPIHVQLSNKAGHIAVLEVVGKHVTELLAGKQAKGVFVGVGVVPPDHLLEVGVAQHGVQLVDKGILLVGGALLIGAHVGIGRYFPGKIRYLQS